MRTEELRLCLLIAHLLLYLQRNTCLASFVASGKEPSLEKGEELSDPNVLCARFFTAEGCKLRLGTYTSYNTMCTYLESDSTAAAGQERNFWVKSRVAVLNQRHPERTQWKESAICTKTWNNSVLQLVQVRS